jgi:hypothetical protein
MRINDPSTQKKYRKQRLYGRSGYFVVRDPHGRHAKVKRQNIGFIPKTWTIYKGLDYRVMYDAKGDLTELVHCAEEITSKKHAQWFESIRNQPIGMIFGRLSDGKGKKNLFRYTASL